MGVANPVTATLAGGELVAELDDLGMVWDPLDADWLDGIAAARTYREAHGHLRVPARYITDDGFHLGRWISVRRLRRHRLSDDRVTQLDELGMVWDPFAEDWRRAIGAGRAFRDEYGHLRVRSGYVTAEGFRLGDWIEARRREHRKGRLAESRVVELDTMGIDWNPPRGAPLTWSPGRR